jgi:uncharacterized protein
MRHQNNDRDKRHGTSSKTSILKYINTSRSYSKFLLSTQRCEALRIDGNRPHVKRPPYTLPTTEDHDLPDTPEILPAPDDAPASPVRPPFSIGDVFVGSEGLRAGWSLLLYVALLAAVLMGSGFLLHGLQSHLVPTNTALTLPRSVFFGEGLQLFAVVVATWIMSKIEQRPVSVFGLARERSLVNFLAGLAWGGAMLSLLVLSLRATGLLVFDARLLFGRSAFRYGAIWLLGFLLIGLFEEYFFRGYLQFTLARGLSGIYGWLHVPRRDELGFWTSAVLLSFGFGLVHRSNPGESPIGLLAAGLIGVVFCLSLWRTGSLWWVIGFHASWDWAQSFLYGVADSGLMVQGHLFATHPVGKPILSGGLTGPEGSILILPIVGLITVVIFLTLPRIPHVSYVIEDAPQPQLHLDLQ